VEAQAQAQGRDRVDAKNVAPAKPVVVVTHAAKLVGQVSRAQAANSSGWPSTAVTDCGLEGAYAAQEEFKAQEN
jgi:hypothetical protein